MKAIIQNWNFIRLLRLVLGVAILVQGIIIKDVSTILLGIVFAAMPVFNIGCCGTNGCAVNTKKSNKSYTNIEYEELDTKK
jgi:cytochrome c oxidase assembly protein Cox11